MEFLQWLRPLGPWNLVAIAVDRRKVEATTCATQGEILSWLEARRDWNHYYTVNSLIRPMAKKPSREDIKAMEFLHVDIDPKPGADLAEERARILKALSEARVRPSCIVFSGGGFQAFWRLQVPVPIDGDPEKYEQALRWNLQLELDFGGDSCHNVDRIMRLPGTVNWPDEKKVKKGRTPQLARVVETSDAAHDISAFTPAAAYKPESGGFGGGTVKVSANVSRVANLKDLPVSDMVRNVISQGCDPDDPTRWTSRSEPLFWVCCEMVRAGVPDDTIYAVITDPDWTISASVLDKGSRASKYAIRQIERAKEEAVNPCLRELNEKFAVVMAGGKTRVIKEEEELLGEHSRAIIHYMTIGDFEAFHCNRHVDIGTADKPALIPLGKWWIRHQQRRQYDSVSFSPGREIPKSYNLWRGFACESKAGGSCDLFLQHVLENVCSGSQEHYAYLLGWMARAVQHPEEPGHSAIVLRGKQGTGKGVFANTFGSLFGRHYLAVRDSSHLFERFNAHLEDCVILFADEAVWAGNKRHEGMLKSLVTEPAIMIEGKGLDARLARNHVHVIMASNEDWVVPAGPDDRRFFVLDVSDARAQEHAYFERMNSQMANGGREALLHMLMSHDVGTYNVRAIPKTRALQKQKLLSISPQEDWWMQKLEDGRLLTTHSEWAGRVFVTELQHEHDEAAKKWRRGDWKMRPFLERVAPGVKRVQVSGEYAVLQLDGQIRKVTRPYAYVFPSLSACRAKWDKDHGGPFSWEDPEEVSGEATERSPY